jgi:hypothetical protein
MLVSTRSLKARAVKPEVLIPWDWAITPTSEAATDKYPSRAKILGIFGAVNVVTLVFGLLLISLKSRLLARWRKGGGKAEGESGSSRKRTVRPWMFLCIIQVMLIFAANALNGHITVSTSGYNEERLPAVADLTFFYMLRPRLTWAGIGIMSCWSPPFAKALLPSQVAEIVLQLCGLYYKGRILAASFPTPYFMKPDLLEPESLKSSWTMMVYPSFTFIVCSGVFGFSLVVSYLTKSNPKAVFKFSYTSMALCWIVDWIIVAGYVGLANDLFCPPKFEIQGIVWTVGTLLGLLFGTGI